MFFFLHSFIFVANRYLLTYSAASATPVQQASHVDQISDLPTLLNKNNSSL